MVGIFLKKRPETPAAPIRRFEIKYGAVVLEFTIRKK